MADLYHAIADDLSIISTQISANSEIPPNIQNIFDRIADRLPKRESIDYFVEDFSTKQSKLTLQDIDIKSDNVTCFPSNRVQLNLRFYTQETVSKISISNKFVDTSDVLLEISSISKKYVFQKLQLNKEDIIHELKTPIVDNGIKLVFTTKSQHICVGKITFY